MVCGILVFKILASKGKIVVNFTNKIVSKLRLLVGAPRTPNSESATKGH